MFVISVETPGKTTIKQNQLGSHGKRHHKTLKLSYAQRLIFTIVQSYHGNQTKVTAKEPYSMKLKQNTTNHI